MLKGMDFCHFARKNRKQSLDTGLDSLKTASKKVVCKTGELLGDKIADAVTSSYDDKIVKTKPAEEIIIQPEKREKN